METDGMMGDLLSVDSSADPRDPGNRLSVSRHRPVGTVRVCAPFGRGRRAFA